MDTESVLPSQRILTAANKARPASNNTTQADLAQSRNLLSNATILQLPDELIVSIIGYATYVPAAERAPRGALIDRMHKPAYDIDTSLVKSICLVCLRLKRIAQPSLFRDVTFTTSTSTIPPSPNVIKLWNVLKNRQDLRQYCKSLQLYILNPNLAQNPESYYVVRDFAKWMTRITYLSIRGGLSGGSSGPSSSRLNAQTWDLVRTMVSNMKDVEELVITRTWQTALFDELFDELNFPKLRTLRIIGTARTRKIPVLQAEKHRTAPFTTLCLSKYEQAPDSLPVLLRWPAILTHFEFYGSKLSYEVNWLETSLLIHKDTLKYLKFGILKPDSTNCIFNACLFPALEFLRMSSSSMPEKLTYEAMVNLLGPNLRTIVLDLKLSERRIEYWRNLSDYEVEWLQLLANVASNHVNLLKKVDLQFTHKYWGNAEELGYLWKKLDQIRDEVMRPVGIELVHSEPDIEVKDW